MNTYYRIAVTASLPARVFGTNCVEAIVAELTKKYCVTECRIMRPAFDAELVIIIEEAANDDESPDEIVRAISHIVWDKMNRYVPITASVNYVEESPCDVTTIDEQAYQAYVNSKTTNKE